VVSSQKYLIILPSSDFGGLASLSASLANGIQDRGFQVCLISLYSRVAGKTSSIRELTLSRAPKETLPGKIANLLVRSIRLRRYLRRERPDYVICLDPVSLLLTLIAGNRSGFKTVGACYTPLNLLTRRDKFLIRRIFRFANFVVSPSFAMSSEITSLNRRLIPKIIPNPLPFDSTFCPLNYSTSKSTLQVHFLGRLSAEKGLRKFLEIAKARPSLDFVVSGDGPDHALMNEYNLGNVRFNGWVSSTACLTDADVLIVPSLFESFGIVVLEAWIHGVPVLTSINAKGPAELVYENNLGDVVLNPENLSEWLEKLETLIYSRLPDEEMARVINKYSEYSVTSRWIEMLDAAEMP